MQHRLITTQQPAQQNKTKQTTYLHELQENIYTVATISSKRDTIYSARITNNVGNRVRHSLVSESYLNKLKCQF